MAKNADKARMIKNLALIFVFWKLFTWEPFWGCVGLVVFLAYELGHAVGVRSAAAARLEPDRPSGAPGQTSTAC